MGDVGDVGLNKESRGKEGRGSHRPLLGSSTNGCCSAMCLQYRFWVQTREWAKAVVNNLMSVSVSRCPRFWEGLLHGPDCSGWNTFTQRDNIAFDDLHCFTQFTPVQRGPPPPPLWPFRGPIAHKCVTREKGWKQHERPSFILFQICRFCWNKIRTEGSGNCPACRY